MEVIDEPFGTTTASWSPLGTVRAPTTMIPSPPDAAKTGGASPTPPMSMEPEAAASSMGGPEVKSSQVTLNGSVLSRPAACRMASAPVPFWSPTFSVTEDRLAELDAGALAAALAGVDEAAGSELEPELLDEEQAAAASPVRARTGIAISFRLGFMIILLFRLV